MSKLNKALQTAIDLKLAALHQEEVYIDGIYEYDYVIDNSSKDVSIHTLFYSNDDHWTNSIKNETALELVDNGNGVIIRDLEFKDDDNELNYLQVEQLHILLRLHSEPSTYQLAKPSILKDF